MSLRQLSISFGHAENLHERQKMTQLQKIGREEENVKSLFKIWRQYSRKKKVISFFKDDWTGEMA